MNDPVVELKQVTKVYGPVTAVDRLSLAIRRGEFFSLLGPSGCGKTTTLRLLAGLERPEPDGGEVRLLGELVNDRPPYERPVAMVFQSYALFPHLDVARNVAFGLEERRRPKNEIARRVGRALELVRLDPAVYGGRRPAELSGGQRQRVALARALVLEPQVLLLDEPLGALDLQLRKAMQVELKALNRTLGITFVFVTHDQEEALVMSDRIAVMDRARIAQVGTPAEIYEHPRTAFVAGFIGRCNLFIQRAEGREHRVAVRPERVELRSPGAGPSGEGAAAGPGGPSAAGAVWDVVYLGSVLHVVVRLDDGTDATVALPNAGQLSHPAAWKRGDRAVLAWRSEDATVLDD
jgi:putative spermidine/putrescine transport system ATP-binding protein